MFKKIIISVSLSIKVKYSSLSNKFKYKHSYITFFILHDLKLKNMLRIIYMKFHNIGLKV